MDLNLPIIAIIGGKKSGKTTVVEFLVKAFTSKGFKVATAKHISLPDFSLDKKGTDTWSRLCGCSYCKYACPGVQAENCKG